MSCNPVSVLPGAQSRVWTQCPPQDRAFPSGLCLYLLPIWWLFIHFLLPCCLWGSSTLKSNLSTALVLFFFLNCGIFFFSQSDKSLMASPHERTAAASSRCCSIEWPWSGILGFKTVLHLLFTVFLEGPVLDVSENKMQCVLLSLVDCFCLFGQKFWILIF